MKLVDAPEEAYSDATEEYLDCVCRRRTMIKRKRSLYRYLSESLPEKERALFQEYACLASHLAMEREDDAWAAGYIDGAYG